MNPIIQSQLNTLIELTAVNEMLNDLKISHEEYLRIMAESTPEEVQTFYETFNLYLKKVKESLTPEKLQELAKDTAQNEQ